MKVVCVREFLSDLGNYKMVRIFTEGKKYDVDVFGPNSHYRLQDDLGSERSYSIFKDHFKTIDEIRDEKLKELGI